MPNKPTKKRIEGSIEHAKKNIESNKRKDKKSKAFNSSTKKLFYKGNQRTKATKKIDNGKVKNPFSSSENSKPEPSSKKIKNPFEKVENKGKKFDGFKPGKARSEAIKEEAKQGLNVSEISE